MIDFNKEIKLFYALSSCEDEDDKNSITSPSMDKERKGQNVLPILVSGTFDLRKVFEV